jgi:phosphatidylglycerophosphatase A
MTTPGNESRLARAVATVGGLGDLMPAPGTTAGSLPAAILWWGVCMGVDSFPLRLALTVTLTVVATAVGVWACTVEAARRGRSDPRPVVIDEVAGQWLCFAVSLLFLRPEGWLQLAVMSAAGFLLFRFFDVVKPWPIRRLERIPGGVGIVADDLAAGAAAGLILAALWPWLSRL